VCTNGVCGCPAERPTLCSGTFGDYCANLTDDRESCGTCGNICPIGRDCVSGACN
jgi:hypothetical protein